MEKIFSQSYFLTPAECNPKRRMPITLLINRLIEVATLHANEIGIGFADLKPLNQTWVLSRVAVEMERYPSYNENYNIRTWICGVNRLFSERNFEILDGDGNTIGYARTIWAVLDMTTRQACDISRLEWVTSWVPEGVQCPIEAPARLRPAKEFESVPYKFTYCDLDFNRHVNSSRYIELLLNQWSLDFHDAHVLRRFEIAYLHEAYYNEEIEVRLSREDPALVGAADVALAELVHEGNALCRAKMLYVAS